MRLVWEVPLGPIALPYSLHFTYNDKGAVKRYVSKTRNVSNDITCFVYRQWLREAIHSQDAEHLSSSFSIVPTFGVSRLGISIGDRPLCVTLPIARAYARGQQSYENANRFE